MQNIIEDYKKYRWFFTSSGKLVIGGKSSLQNDELLRRIKSSNHDFLIMHTASPGSPFSVILDNIKKVNEKDLKECAIFTASFSRAWKSGKKKAIIHAFKSSQIYKSRDMKAGTWGVSGPVNAISASLHLVLAKQEGILKAIPESAANKKQILLKIAPGKIDKKDMPAKLSIELGESISQEEILSALPSGGFKILRK